jgi:hypothetical protein
MDALPVAAHLAAAAEFNATSYLATTAAKASTQAYDQSLVIPFPSLDPRIKAAVASQFRGTTLRFCGDKAAAVPLSGHTFHSVFRFAVRARFESKLSVQRETLPTLVIGSAFREVKDYGNNPYVSYWFYAGEPKDTDRIIRPMLQSIASKANSLARKASIKFQTRTTNHQNALNLLGKFNAAIPISLAEWNAYFPKVKFPSSRNEFSRTLNRLCKSQNPQNIQAFKDARYLRLSSSHDVLATFQQLCVEPRLSEPDQPIHYKQFIWGPKYTHPDPDRRPFRGVLHDVGYSFDDRTWFKIFETTGITVANGYMFCPTRLLFPDMVDDPTYSLQIIPNQRLSNPLAAWCESPHWQSPTHDRVRLTFKGDDGNGYEEDYQSWRSYLTRRVMFDPTNDVGYALLLNIEERQGDYIIYSITKVTTRVTVPWIISVPNAQYYVKVFDVLSYYESVSSPAGVTTNPRNYISVLQSEWDQILLYIGRSNPDSVTFHLALTSAYRKAFAILESHDEEKRWKVNPSRLNSVVLCALLYHTHTRHNLDMSLAQSHTTDYMTLLNLVLERLNIVRNTFSNAVAQILGAKLPLVIHPDMEQSFYNEYDARDSFGNSTLSDTVSDNLDVSIPIFPSSTTDKISCTVCKSLFPATQLGQVIRCQPSEDSTWEFNLSVSELSDLSSRLSQQISSLTHSADTVGLHTVLTNARSALPKLPISYKVKVLVFVGGPGVGKTRFASTLRTSSEDLVVSPYDLSSAYKNSPATFLTHHKALTCQTVFKKVIIDEFQSMDLDLLTVILSKAQPQILELHGDPKQPNILESQGEGRSIVHHVLGKKSFTTHEYGLSYRCTLSSICVLNNVFGYNLTTNSDVTNDIELVPFSATWFENHPTVPAISFNADTVAQMLGTTKNPKSSVRSATGSTHKELALVIRNEDVGLLQVDSLAIVAISRHTDKLYLIYETTNVRASIEARYCLDKIPSWSANPPRPTTPDTEPSTSCPLLDSLTSSTVLDTLDPFCDHIFHNSCQHRFTCGHKCNNPDQTITCAHDNKSQCQSCKLVPCAHEYFCGYPCPLPAVPSHSHTHCCQYDSTRKCLSCCPHIHPCNHVCSRSLNLIHSHADHCLACNPIQVVPSTDTISILHQPNFPVDLLIVNEPTPVSPPKKSYTYHPTPGDGNCMYHALAQSFDLINKSHNSTMPTTQADIRAALSSQLTTNTALRNTIKSVFASMSAPLVKHHLRGIATNAWGTDQDLQLVSQLFNIAIVTVDLAVFSVPVQRPKINNHQSFSWHQPSVSFASALTPKRRYRASSQCVILPTPHSDVSILPIVYIGYHGNHYAHLVPYTTPSSQTSTMLCTRTFVEYPSVTPIHVPQPEEMPCAHQPSEETASIPEITPAVKKTSTPNPTPSLIHTQPPRFEHTNPLTSEPTTTVTPDQKPQTSDTLWSDESDTEDEDLTCPCHTPSSLYSLLVATGYPEDVVKDVIHNKGSCLTRPKTMHLLALSLNTTFVVSNMVIQKPDNNPSQHRVLTTRRTNYGDKGFKVYLTALTDIHDPLDTTWETSGPAIVVNTVSTINDLSDPSIVVHPVSWSKHGIIVHVPADGKCVYSALNAASIMSGHSSLFSTVFKSVNANESQFNVPAIDEDYHRMCDLLNCAIRVHHALPDSNPDLYLPSDSDTPSFTLNIVIKDLHAHALLPAHPSVDTSIKAARRIAERYRNMAGGTILVPNPKVVNPVPSGYLDLTTHFLKPADESFKEISVPDERPFFSEGVGLRPFDGFRLIEDVVSVRSNLQPVGEHYGSLTPANIANLSTKMLHSRAKVNVPHLIQPLNKSNRPLQDEIVRHRYMHSQGIDFLSSCPAQELRTAHSRYVSSKGIKLSSAGRQLAARISNNFIRNYMNPIGDDPQEESETLNEALTDALRKHYPDRLRDFSTFDYKRINFFMKEIFKVSRSDHTDPNKAGQGISAWDPTVVSLFHSLMRIMGRRFARSLKSNAVFNNRLTQVELMEKVKLAMSTVHPCAIGGYMDGTQFDSCQNAFTQEIERNIMKKLGMPEEALEAYYLVRNDYLLSSQTLSAIIDSAKTSGEPGTLLFNTILMMCLTSWLLKAKTTQTVIVGQGDDCFIYGVGLSLDQAELSNVGKHTKMKLKCQVGGKISFCGMSYSNGKFFLDLERRYKKLVGTTYRDYNHFAEVQNAVRDFILDVKQSANEGISETIRANISVSTSNPDYNRQFDYFLDVFHAIESIAHLNASQFHTHFRPITVSRTEPR